MATTMMACEPPVMESDAWVTTLLSAQPSWTLSGDTLTLTTDTITVTLADKKVVDPDRPVQGTAWTVDVAHHSRRRHIQPGTRNLGAGTHDRRRRIGHRHHRMQPHDGSATVTDTTITFAPMGTTRMACEPEVADIERHVLTVLDGEVTVAVDAAT